MNTTRKKTTQRGFTLIELMVALVVLTIGLFSIIHLQVVTVRGHTYARERAEAYEIGLGVAQNLQVLAKEWVEMRVGGNQSFQAVFGNMLGANSLVNPAPQAGNPIPIASLQSVQRYLDIDTSADANPGTASAINIFGRNPVTDAGLLGARGGYRVHYIAYNIPLRAGEVPDLRVVRVIIFVSWESKDHGTDVDWTNWWNGGAGFWNRHMVTVTTTIRQARHY